MRERSGVSALARPAGSAVGACAEDGEPTTHRRDLRLDSPGGRAATVDRFRPDIQGLRAVAVLLVVVFHLWPNRLTGGYVGVDVFFVISGYLITSHIVREAEATGTVRLSRFWARRVRRLLPASLLVLVASGAAVVALVPATEWGLTARQLAASALYVQNWALASDAVDYMAADNDATVAQHYWSLSVEEQFYVVWPLLVLAAVAIHRRSGLGSRRQWLGAVLVLVALASFVYSVVATSRGQASAYFVTQTRAWEFTAGALLALSGSRIAWGPVARALVGWLSLAALVAAGFLFDDSTPFPGWVALLPVAGTVGLIAVGVAPAGWGSPSRWLGIAPARWLGDISYSVYLWHWPLIVVLPYVSGDRLRLLDKAVVFVATLALAVLTKRFVEDPGRTRPFLAAAPWRSLAFAVAGTALVVAGSQAIGIELDRRTEAAPVAAAEAPCRGPDALVEESCGPPQGDGRLVPAPEVVVQQNVAPPYPECQAPITGSRLARCELGAPEDEAVRTVALVGDSHAAQWFPMVEELGRDLGWRVVTYTKASCPMTAAVRVLPSEQTDEGEVGCSSWNDRVMDDLLDSDEISYVLTTSFSTAYEWASPAGATMEDPGTEGFRAAWGELLADGREVFVLGDIPRTQGENVPNCLALHPEDRMACAAPRETALPGSPMVDAARDAGAGVRLIDLTDRFCDETTCYPVVGDVVVYRDYSHLAVDYARALVPAVREELDRAGALD